MDIMKRHYRELERLFESEVHAAMTGGCGLIQSRAKVYRELAEMGLAENVTETIGHDRFGRIAVTGWSLTHAGRLAHCMTCADSPLPDGEP